VVGDSHDDLKLLRAYRVLGLERWASDKDLKQRYRDLARVWHPDRFAEDARMQARAEEELKTINAAFDLVKTERARNGSRPSSRAQGSASTGWRCPDCGNPVEREDQWCEVCCRRLTFDADKPAARARTGWRCPDCDAAVAKDDWCCRKCGRRLKFGS
jgi:hypothetical protein